MHKRVIRCSSPLKRRQEGLFGLSVTNKRSVKDKTEEPFMLGVKRMCNPDVEKDPCGLSVRLSVTNNVRFLHEVQGTHKGFNPNPVGMLRTARRMCLSFGALPPAK